MYKNNKLWISIFFGIVICVLAFTAYKSVSVDPFFHYHKPDTDKYFYRINNERSQNDGILKRFDYTGVITGTSMTENFKTSEADDLFGEKFIKVPFSGGSYKEINDNLKIAASYNKNLKIVIRSLDLDIFFNDKDYMYTGFGVYPTYLYDENLFNDAAYVFNRDVVFNRVYQMEKAKSEKGFTAGITTFDVYANWMRYYSFGKNAVLANVKPNENINSFGTISEKEIQNIRENIKQNITDLADAYPDITFYYFFPPYSAVYWQNYLNTESLDRSFQAERIYIEEILKHDNIKLYSFTDLFEITTDLNNYKDSKHYGEWINSLMLRYLFDGKNLLTEDNYEYYLNKVSDFYKNYDYSQLKKGEDYENDYYAAALLNQQITGTVPFRIDLNASDDFELSNAVIAENGFKGNPSVICTGRLQRSGNNQIADYIRDEEYVGIKISVEDAAPFRYLVFYGRRTVNQGEPLVLLYDDKGTVVKTWNKKSKDLDTNWHQYLIDISDVKGPVTLVMNGGAPSRNGKANSKYIFSEMVLY